MGDDKTANEFPSQQQRYLVCARQWEADRNAFADTYADYGEGVRNNAKRGIELNERNGNKCATQTGKVRAQQLAKGEGISLETIKRMHSYLSRGNILRQRRQHERLWLHELPAMGRQGGTRLEQK